jgi:hypothetical protein
MKYPWRFAVPGRSFHRRLHMRLLIAGVLVMLGCATSGGSTSAGAGAGGGGGGGGANCGSMRSVIAPQGIYVLAQPDNSANPVTYLSTETPVCVSGNSYGFGFRKVKLPNGTEGYVEESKIDVHD